VPRHAARPSSMSYAFAPHIYAAQIGDAFVLLDLITGRYKGVSGNHAQQLRAVLEDAPCHCSMSEVWVRQGVLVPSDRTSHPFASDFIDLGAPLTALEDVITPTHRALCGGCAHAFLSACLQTHWQLRARSLLAIAERLHARKRELRGRYPEDALVHAVEQFRLLRPFAFTAADRCLFHALALTSYLVSQQLPATWVIGVRLHPWGAHSWVQSGCLVLDATPEIVREYTPILAV
jgi:Transglutaminase-like superfamily